MRKQIKKPLNRGCIMSDLEGPIDDAIDFLIQLRIQHSEPLFLEEDYGYEDKRLIVHTYREETETEYNTRIAQEKRSEDARKEHIKQEAIKLGLLKE